MGLLPALIGLGGTLLSRDKTPKDNTTNTLNSASVGQTSGVQSGTESSTATGKTATYGTENTNTSNSTRTNSTDIATSIGNALTQNTGTSTQNTQASTSNVGATTSTESGTVRNNGTTLGFEAGVMQNLNGLLSSAVDGSGFTNAQNAVNGQLNRVTGIASAPGFDPAAYAAGITQRAASSINSDLESNIDSLASTAGGSQNGNTMVALLANKMRGEAAANLAGITSEATAAGRQIASRELESQSGQIAQLQQSGADTLSNLIGVLSGAQSSNTSAQATVNTGSQNTVESGSQSGTASGMTTDRGSQTTNSTDRNTSSSAGVSTGSNNTNSVQSQNTNTTSAGKTNITTAENATALESGLNKNTDQLFQQLAALFAKSNTNL